MPPISTVRPEPGPWQALADMIGELSQDVWFAGWARDIEHMAWEWLQQPTDAPSEARSRLPELQRLADEGGHWVRWDDERGIVPVHLDRWRRRHVDWLAARKR